MNKNFLSIILFLIPFLLPAAISPAAYANAQANASDVLLVKTDRVTKYRLRGNRILVKVRAKVLRRYRSSTRRRTKWITIRYTTRLPRRTKMLGSGYIPILSPDTVYKVYLNRKRGRFYYAPAAGNRSFRALKARKRHIYYPHKRLF